MRLCWTGKPLRLFSMIVLTGGLLLVLSACSYIPGLKPAPTPNPTLVEEPVAIGVPPLNQESIDQLGELLDGIGEQISGLRGLALKEPVDREFMTREELASFLLKKFEEENSREELLKDQAVLNLLGLLEDDVVLLDLLLSLLTEQVLGLFDPDTEKLYVIREKSEFGPLEETTFAHEIVHALQQQHFDIDALSDAVEEDSEASAALSALIEGDAYLAGIGYAFTFLDSSQLQALLEPPDTHVFDAAPEVIQQLFLFSPLQGTEFVTALFESGGWEAVNGAYQSPPMSTEQILHPPRYLSGDTPVTVTLPDLIPAMGAGWSQVDSDVMGEFFLRIYLESQLGPRRAARAAEGWGGDTFALWAGPGEQRLMALMTQWDTPGDAQEFFEAYVAFSEAKGKGQWPLLAKGSGRRWWRAPGQSVYLSRVDANVLLLLAPEDPLVEPLLAQFPRF